MKDFIYYLTVFMAWVSVPLAVSALSLLSDLRKQERRAADAEEALRALKDAAGEAFKAARDAGNSLAEHYNSILQLKADIFARGLELGVNLSMSDYLRTGSAAWLRMAFKAMAGVITANRRITEAVGADRDALSEGHARKTVMIAGLERMLGAKDMEIRALTGELAGLREENRRLAETPVRPGPAGPCVEPLLKTGPATGGPRVEPLLKKTGKRRGVAYESVTVRAAEAPDKPVTLAWFADGRIEAAIGDGSRRRVMLRRKGSDGPRNAPGEVEWSHTYNKQLFLAVAWPGGKTNGYGIGVRWCLDGIVDVRSDGDLYEFKPVKGRKE